MGIESTIELTRNEAILRLESRLKGLLDTLPEKSNEELEELLYGTRESIFDNFSIITHIN